MSQLVHCPTCKKPFRVLPEQLGAKVKCPNCMVIVQVPSVIDQVAESEQLVTEDQTPNLSPKSSPEARAKLKTKTKSKLEENAKPTVSVGGKPRPLTNKPTAFACPHCGAKFGVTQDMVGTEVGCPSCKKAVRIPGAQVIVKEKVRTQPKDAEFGTKSDEAVKPTSPKPRWKSRESQGSPDLFAPGHKNSRPREEEDDSERPPTTAPARSGGSQLLDEPKPLVKKPVDHLLPPRFDIFDPTSFVPRVSEENQKVYLPDGSGGVKRVDHRVVSVNYAGEKVKLATPTNREKSNRRFWSNFVTLAILGGVLLLALFLILKYL